MTAPAPSRGAESASRQTPGRALLWILALGLVHGLIYLAVFPPWQHYDEPSHLEYVLLIARRGTLPRPGDYDLSMRREIASSMAAHGFYRGLDLPAIDFWSDVPPSIGVDELVHPPLYYLLLALAVRPFLHQGVEVQLVVARLCSLGLYLVVLLAAYKLVAEAFPRQRWLPPAVAILLALLPPFNDRMTSVNSDAGATAATSLLLWAAVGLARRGVSARRVLALAATTGLCLATKTTAAVVALASVVVLVLLLLPGKVRRWACLGIVVLAVAFLVALVANHDHAASWYSVSPGGAPNRVEGDTPLDGSGFVLSGQGRAGPAGIVQELPLETGRALRGHTVTFGAWVRAAEGGEGNVLFGLDEGDSGQEWVIHASGDWQLFRFRAEIGADARGVALLARLPTKVGTARKVYLDGLFLVDAPLAPETVAIADPAAGRVRSGTEEWPNLLQNGSAQQSWPALPSALGNRVVGRSSATEILFSLWDWRRTAWVLGPEVRALFRSFWGGFGWNHLQLPAGVFGLLVAVSCLAATGIARALICHLRRARQESLATERAWVLLAGAWIVGWGMVLLRIYPVLVTARIWWPVARYADVVMVPSALLLCGGLATIVPSRLAKAAACVGLLGLLALDAAALGLVILPYYYG